MRRLLFTCGLSLLSAAAFGADNCEQIKGEIDAKIKNVGVQVYKLVVVDANENVAGKVVGTCDAGKKKIVYWRGTT